MSSRQQEAAQVFVVAFDHHRHDRLDEAIRGYSKALVLNPAYAEAYANLGVALRAQGRVEAAVACYRRSIAINGEIADVFSNLGNALRELGRYETAIEAHENAVRLAPRSAHAVYNLGLVLRDLGRLALAVECFDRALVLRPEYPDCTWDRALTLLMAGDLKAGFAAYESRRARPNWPRSNLRRPAWDGSPLDGRVILVRPEPGVSDLIQFVRYVALLDAAGGRVVVECPPDLARLFATVPGVRQIVIEGTRRPSFDVHAAMLDLPGLLGTTLETVPRAVPYLAAPELHNVHLPAPIGSHLKVGIAWDGPAANPRDRGRVCPLLPFVNLFDLPGIAFYSLATGELAAEDIAAAACEALITPVGDRLEDFADTAAAVAQLDLIIAVDSPLVHIAGALARPVWTLLPAAADWRWLTDRDDSPWYPTMHLYRQAEAGRWDDVFASLRRDLAALVRSVN
jgi:Tfp pilus assembly protein PilF